MYLTFFFFFFIALDILNLNNQIQSTSFNLKQACLGERKDPFSKGKKGSGKQ